MAILLRIQGKDLTWPRKPYLTSTTPITILTSILTTLLNLFALTTLASSLLLKCTFSSVAQSCLTLWDPMGCSRSGLPVHHQLPEFTQIHVHWVSDAIQPSHPLPSPSPPSFNLSQHQGLFKWVISSHQVAKVWEFQPQHQSFQWLLRTYLL